MSERIPPVTHQQSEAAIERYADLATDRNPLHVDPAYAAQTEFGAVIAHGPIALQTCFEAVSAWLGRESLPPGSSVEAVFRAPVYATDAVTFAGTLEEPGVVRGDCVTSGGAVAISVEVRLPG